jgi:hypothetical protein
MDIIEGGRIMKTTDRKTSSRERFPASLLRIISISMAVVLLLSAPLSSKAASFEFNIENPIDFTNGVKLLLTGQEDGEWQKYGTTITSTSDDYYLWLHGEIAAIEFKGGLGLGFTLGGHVLQEAVKGFLDETFSVHIDMAANKTTIDLSGPAVGLMSGQRVEFYYKPHRLSFVQQVSNVSRGEFSVIDNVEYGYKIYNSDGSLHRDTMTGFVEPSKEVALPDSTPEPTIAPQPSPTAAGERGPDFPFDLFEGMSDNIAQIKNIGVAVYDKPGGEVKNRLSSKDTLYRHDKADRHYVNGIWFVFIQQLKGTVSGYVDVMDLLPLTGDQVDGLLGIGDSQSTSTPPSAPPSTSSPVGAGLQSRYVQIKDQGTPLFNNKEEEQVIYTLGNDAMKQIFLIMEPNVIEETTLYYYIKEEYGLRAGYIARNAVYILTADQVSEWYIQNPAPTASPTPTSAPTQPPTPAPTPAQASPDHNSHYVQAKKPGTKLWATEKMEREVFAEQAHTIAEGLFRLVTPDNIDASVGIYYVEELYGQRKGYVSLSEVNVLTDAEFDVWKEAHPQPAPSPTTMPTDAASAALPTPSPEDTGSNQRQLIGNLQTFYVVVNEANTSLCYKPDKATERYIVSPEDDNIYALRDYDTDTIVDGNQWYRIEMLGGVENGYVLDSEVTILTQEETNEWFRRHLNVGQNQGDPADNDTDLTYTTGTYGSVLVNNTNVRKTATNDRVNSLGFVNKNELVRILGTQTTDQGSFYKIQTLDGIVGYVPNIYIANDKSSDVAYRFNNQKIDYSKRKPVLSDLLPNSTALPGLNGIPTIHLLIEEINKNSD